MSESKTPEQPSEPTESYTRSSDLDQRVATLRDELANTRRLLISENERSERLSKELAGCYVQLTDAKGQIERLEDERSAKITENLGLIEEIQRLETLGSQNNLAAQSLVRRYQERISDLKAQNAKLQEDLKEARKM